jgi:hydrogenase nickel incorporation protein HypA/HybF
MHEIGLMQEALNVALKQAKQVGATRVERVTLRVGEASGADYDVLRMSFAVATQGTIAEGATLDIEPTPIVCQCSSCGHEFTPQQANDMGYYECPQCHRFTTQIKQGRDIEVGI